MRRPFAQPEGTAVPITRRKMLKAAAAPPFAALSADQDAILRRLIEQFRPIIQTMRLD